MQYGRKEIFCDVEEITAENIIPILQDSMIIHLQNAADCTELIRFEKGQQEKIRKKQYRSDIDVWCVDNIANEITEFKVGFNWGNPITLVQRGEKDSGNKAETEAIALLNECYDAEEIKRKTQELARFVEICGVGYTIVDINTEWEEGESYFTVNVLDPRYAFIVRSSYYLDRRPMLGVTYRKDSKGNFYFTCFSKNERFEILNATKIIYKNGREKDIDDWKPLDGNAEKNPLNRIPIVEWIRSYDRMGCFERQIPEMNNLNLLVSDFTNDVDQNTQAIWHGNDIEFPKDKDTGEEQQPKTNDWVITQTTQDGKTPFIKPLAIEYDYNGMLNQMIYRVNRIKEKCNVPQRNDNSGGSTGIAMSDATGWTNAEVEATRQDQIKDGCKMEEVKIVLAAIQKSPFIEQSNPLLSLRFSDVKPNIKRQKNYEMTTKINTYATGVSHGLAPEHMVAAINFFDDPHQVTIDSAPYTKAYLESTFGTGQTQPVGGEGEKKPNADRLDQDRSDQISNSPLIDGMRTE